MLNAFKLVFISCFFGGLSLLAVFPELRLGDGIFFMLIESAFIGVATYFLLLLIFALAVDAFFSVWPKCICGKRLDRKKLIQDCIFLMCKKCRRTYVCVNRGTLIVQIKRDRQEIPYMQEDRKSGWHTAEGNCSYMKIPEDVFKEIEKYGGA